MFKTEAQKRGLYEKRIHMGVFDFEVIVITGKYEDACKYVSWKFEDKETDLMSWDNGYIPRGKCFFRRGYVPVVWVPRKPRNAREWATLSHECLHAVFHLFEWVNLPINRDTEEVMAHAMAHLIAGAFKK